MATAKLPPDSESAIRLAIGSRLELLSLIHAIIEGIAREQKLDDETTMALQVAVIEAGTNAIQHGNVFAETKAVKFDFRVQNGGIEVQVDDFGKGFDPSKVDDPTSDESHLLSPHGRGLFLMRSLMDEVTFEERPDHGTTVRLKKTLSKS
ncbi:MAG TPA: ATP-binding protein [Candidatus Eisenbacteria bacterium]|jgi:anti-sigma regulatory factor (Ser/Thr protein kinase)|nr:ATP-binding protein [Candidatus Eisenbacteria bacterium]